MRAGEPLGCGRGVFESTRSRSQPRGVTEFHSLAPPESNRGGMATKRHKNAQKTEVFFCDSLSLFAALRSV